MVPKRQELLFGLCLLLTIMLACSPGTTPVATQTPTPKPTFQAPTSASLTPTTTAKTTATSSSAPVSFAGKTVTIIVPFAPGGSGDITARLYSRHLSRFLPGNPNVIVRNMPGGGATIGANYAYVARPDGVTAMIAAGSVFLADLLKTSAAHFEMAKMPATIGIKMANIFYLKSGVIAKPEDITKAKGIVFGSTAGGSGWMFVCAKELLDIPVDKVILAYASSGEALRGLLSGEINMSGSSTPAYNQSLAPQVAKGEVMPVFQTGLLGDQGKFTRDPVLPPVPTLAELYQTLNGKAPSGMAWEAYKAVVATQLNYDKVLCLPPGTPDNILRAYWGATDKMVKDAEFRKGADPLVGEGANWMTGEAFANEFKQNLVIEPKVVEWLRATLAKYGVVIE